MSGEAEALSAREQNLTDRNARLTETLREACDTLVEFKACVDAMDRQVAVAAALDYAVRAIDLRIREIDRSVMRGLVGTDVDGALRLDWPAVFAAFEAALKAHGYEVSRVIDLAPDVTP